MASPNPSPTTSPSTSPDSTPRASGGAANDLRIAPAVDELDRDTARRLVKDHLRAEKVALDRALAQEDHEGVSLVNIARFHSETARLLAAAYLGDDHA